MKLFNLRVEEFDSCLGSTIDVYNNQFKLIKSDLDNPKLFDYGAELVNHPTAYYSHLKEKSFKKLYTLHTIDLWTYSYKDNDNDYIYFIDHQHDKFYVYMII